MTKTTRTNTYVSDLGPADEDGEDDGHVAGDGQGDDDAEDADLDEVDGRRRTAGGRGGGRGVLQAVKEKERSE